MKKKKLLHIFSAPQSVFFFLDQQLKFFISNGFEVHIIMPKDNFYTEKILQREPNTHFHFVSLKRQVSLIHDITSLFRIFFLLLKIRPGILHLHTPKASFIGAVAGRLCFQKNIIYQMHGLVSADGFTVKKNYIFYLEKCTCYLADKIFAVSESLKDFAIKNKYCKKSKIIVIHNGTINGIDAEQKFNPANTIRNKYLSEDELNGKFVIGYAGRICADKGIQDFLKVISSLAKKANILGIIAGQNEMYDAFDDLLKKYQLKNSAQLKIFDEKDDVENMICVFNVLLFPTKREGFGLVAAEANALCVPVVAYNIPGVKDAVANNSTGKLVEYADVNKLENAVCSYYENKQEAIEHGINGRERVKRLFNRKNLWQKTLEEYNELL